MSDTTLSFLTTEIGILNVSALVFSKRILLSDINKNGTYVKIEIECHKDSKIRHLFVLIQLLKNVDSTLDRKLRLPTILRSRY